MTMCRVSDTPLCQFPLFAAVQPSIVPIARKRNPLRSPGHSRSNASMLTVPNICGDGTLLHELLESPISKNFQGISVVAYNVDNPGN